MEGSLVTGRTRALGLKDAALASEGVVVMIWRTSEQKRRQ